MTRRLPSPGDLLRKDALERLPEDAACPICGGHTFATGTVRAAKLDLMFHRGGFFRSGRPVLGLECEGCGHLALFAGRQSIWGYMRKRRRQRR